jgi:PAS domain S-box-containing protein
VTLRLLVIEDRSSDFELIQDQLARQGLAATCHRVDTREDLEAALENETWDAVLTDYSVPGLAFQQTVGLVRQRRPELPIVLVSGYMGEDQAATLLEAGIADFVLKYRPARLAAAIRRAVAEMREQQARRAAEAALRESEERLRLAMEAAKLGALRFDCAARTFQLDARAQEHFGLGQQVPYAELQERIFLEDQPRLAAAFLHAADAGSDGRYAIELRALQEDGSARWLSFRGRVNYGTDSRAREPLEHIGVVQDITERKRGEIERRAVEERLMGALRSRDRQPDTPPPAS